MDNQVTNSLGGNVFGKDVRISNPALRIHPDIHYSANQRTALLAGLHVSCRVGKLLITASTTVRQSTLADCLTAVKPTVCVAEQ